MIDTLLFDLDNTLLDFDKAEANAITRALGDVGISATNEMRDCYHKINLAQWKLLEQGKMTREEVESRIRNFLSDLFNAMDMEVAVEVTFNDKEECINVELKGGNMGVLIGKRGQTLDSIQYLTSLVVNKGREKYVRIKMDTEDYRNRRKETLESLAKNIAYKVKRSRRPVALEPMNPYERRIIHSALQNDKFVSTKSEGEEPFRHVVIYLDKEKSANK